MKKYFFGGLMVGATLVIIVLIVAVLCKGHDFVPLRIINPCAIENDSIPHSNKVAIIKELETKGILLTPDEYTSHIVSFYNSLIACLIGTLIVFSFLGYFSMKSKMKEQIQESLEDMMRDSKKFESTILENVYGRATEDFVQVEDFDNLKKDIQGLKSNAEKFMTQSEIIPK